MSDLNVKELSRELQATIAGLKQKTGLEQTGVVTRVSDGVAWIYGLTECGFSEVIEIETSGDGAPAKAFVLNLNEDELGAVLLDSETTVSAGARASLTGKTLEVPVGPELIGRVVDPLGRPIDGAGPIKATATSPIERTAPGVMDRKSTLKSLEFPDMTIHVVGDVAIVRHFLVQESELDGKTTNIKIGVIQVYKKQDGGWKLLARAAHTLPQPA